MIKKYSLYVIILFFAFTLNSFGSDPKMYAVFTEGHLQALQEKKSRARKREEEEKKKIALQKELMELLAKRKKFMIKAQREYKAKKNSVWALLKNAIIMDKLSDFEDALVLFPEYLNHKDESGCTLLMLATKGAKPLFVRKLLNFGANDDLTNKIGMTALQIAYAYRELNDKINGKNETLDAKYEEILALLSAEPG